MKTKVGFIGLGNMGLPMAQQILKGGFPLSVYNRTKEKASPLLDKGAHFAKDPKELAQNCEVLISMVANDAALVDIVEGPNGILQVPKKPAVHVSMSTVSPELTTRLHQKHFEQGIQFLSAPVTGRPERARLGQLWIFMSGDSHAKEKVTPILKTMSTRIFDLGEQSEKAALFKLCNNFMIITFLESFGEALALLEKGGISAGCAAEIWGNSLFDSPLFHAYSKMMCQRNFEEGGFALKLGFKDIKLLEESAEKMNVPMPFLNEIHEKMERSVQKGREDFDWSAISLLSREAGGLPP